MTAFVIKSTASLLLFFLFYRLFLEKENMPVFKRVYLLASLVFSLLVSLVVIKDSGGATITNTLFNNSPIQQGYYTIKSITGMTISAFSYKWILYAVYFLVLLILLYRFVFNLNRLAMIQQSGRCINYDDLQLVLVDQPLLPFSFMQSIYVNEQEYRKGNIPQELLLHESAHVRQLHSADILFIELLQIVFWFNPVILVYKRAIRLNHEYLADSAVLKGKTDLIRYQHQLLTIVFRNNSTYLASCFNY